MTDFVRGLKCRLCGKAYPKEPLNSCADDFGPLEVDYDYDAIAEVQAAEAIASLSGVLPPLAGRILTYDAAALARFRVTDVPARSGCKCRAWRGKSATSSVHQ